MATIAEVYGASFAKKIGLAVIAMIVVLSGCDGTTSDEKTCEVAQAPGHSWTMEDVQVYAQQLRPSPGDEAERVAYFIDGLTALGRVEGGFEDYDPSTAAEHHRGLMSDFHFNRSFEEGTEIAVEEFTKARDELGLEVVDCSEE